MKINFFMLLSLLFLHSCVKNAAPIKAPREYLSDDSVVTENWAQNLSGLEFDSRMRGASLIIYPNSYDLRDFSYHPGKYSMESWETLAVALPYGARLERNYPREMSGDWKVVEMVKTIVSVGDLKNRTFAKEAPLKREFNELGEIIRQENSALKARLKRFPCFYTDRPKANGAWECVAEKRDDGKEYRKKSLRSCRKLKEHHFTFSEGEGELEAEFQEIVNSCGELGVRQASGKRMRKKLRHYQHLVKSGESVVLDILQAAERHLKDKVLLPLIASQAKDAQGESSTLVMNLETLEVSQLRLLIDFGENYSEGSGVEEYSIKNGKISNLGWDKKGSVNILKFDLQTVDFKLSASLAMSVQEVFGLRFVGDATVSYPDGSRSTGIMSFEFDRVREDK